VAKAKHKIVTVNIDSLVKLWQRRLRIEDWDITVQIKRRAEMEEIVGTCPAPLGACRIPDMFQKADIVLMTPTDTMPGDDNIELTLVHEMVHIMMPWMDLGIPNDEKRAEFKVYERIVDRMAHILVGAFNGSN
jgi:hypothetical protein